MYPVGDSDIPIMKVRELVVYTTLYSGLRNYWNKIQKLSSNFRAQPQKTDKFTTKVQLGKGPPFQKGNIFNVCHDKTDFRSEQFTSLRNLCNRVKYKFCIS